MIPFSDLVAILSIALVCALVIGAFGLAVLRLARRAPLLAQLCVVVATAIVSVTVGMIAVAQEMYLSPHDLVVTFYVAGVAALVSLGVALVLGRAFTRNAVRLREITRSISEGQRIQFTADDSQNAEFGDLAADLAETSRRLAESREEVAAMDASRRELIAWISHDLRTPLAGLRAMAEALEDGMAEDPQRFHRQMRLQVEHLSGMVDDLFELSKIQSGTLSLALEPISVYDLVSDAVADVATLAASRSITLRESTAEGLSVLGDARELTRVVGNLLMNAIQHSPAGAEVSISAQPDGAGSAVLSVQDSGGGISEHDLSKIFEPGWRSSAARGPGDAFGSAGAGLGLAIVHGIVTAHQGAIAVRNIAGGCRFDISLPANGPES
ncbi:sensor histidine kinase [Leifsonia sp. Root112D2]|uniref:sensor histidine kinase n=1 Tax=Leifsonia sp. Root112D2 TaxID=1736426 RepID=UPI0006F33216|nr:HAMP domain-containing sensor histidine kinase [Leifsonia sp. Root112D2]KQV07657.1 histidine kinase [Leifsonia sp. Root112D2]